MTEFEDIHLRALTAADWGVLRKATLLNMNWNGPRFTLEDVLADPKIAHYTALEPDRGDFGYLLHDAHEWVSVVWLLFLDHDDPGYGYVRDGVPELSVCTIPSWRGRGLGRRLLAYVISAAEDRGLDSISLSVEDGNPARHLYQELGFAPVRDARNNGTMLQRLVPTLPAAPR